MTYTNRILSGRVLPLLLAALVLFSVKPVRCEDGGGGGTEVQWQILTKLNYSSQIRLHPRLLLLVTVPWSGESRSLMKELGHVVASDEVRFGTLKLMVLYRNSERVLADALGSDDGITIFYYHNTVSYKYRGKFRVQSILSSIHYVMSLSPDDLPLKSLTTPEELGDFLHSTDKAVLLVDFCGWVPRVVGMDKSTTESDLGQGYLGTDFKRENNGTLDPKEKDNRKGLEDDKLGCDSDNGFSGIPWTSQFITVNNSLEKEAENLTFSAGECSSHEFEQFAAFFQKFITVVREFFLPPERHRFAVVLERSLFPLINIEEPGSWFVTVHFAGCPSCSQVLKEVDDLRTVIQSQASNVLELEDDMHGFEAVLPAKRPTMLLFVDRSSNSMQIRNESQEALKAFRDLAGQTQMLNWMHGQTTIGPVKTVETSQVSMTSLKHPRVHSFSASQKFVLKDKMSVMVMKDGQQVTLENLVPNLQGRSLHEILSYAIKRKELKFSSLAKDAGFRLISKDFNIKDVESLPSNSEDQSNLGETPVEDSPESAASHKRQMLGISSSKWNEELSDPSDVEYILLEGREDSSDESSLSSVESEHGHHSSAITADSGEVWNTGETQHLGTDNELQKHFTGSFFFLDGHYRLLEILTGGLKIPSVVIIDPISQEHYVLAEQSVFSYSLLSVFVKEFLAGKLPPYLKSGAVIPNSRNAQRPPFVNLDFHETDSIPRVTTHTFADLVLGNNSDPWNSGHSPNRNILVLFSHSWCGFCQRMELVVREVHRVVAGYANMKINSSRKEKLMPRDEYAADVISKLPLIYMMDCTRNDCSLILKSIFQREVYPLLLLFSAERKNNTVPYEGDISVSDIIKFLAAHGSHIPDLITDKNFLRDQNSVAGGPQSTSLHHEVLLKNSLQNVAVQPDKVYAQLHVGSDERPELFAGCVLTATEQLLDVHPFDESKILVVKADQSTGFKGLIFNKHITWDSLEDLGEGFEFLKEASLSFGGPVMMHGMPLVALTRKSTEGHYIEVLQNVYFIDQFATRDLLEQIRVRNQSAHDYWFFLGYSSWGWEQLVHEIAQGAWNVSKCNMEQLEWP